MTKEEINQKVKKYKEKREYFIHVVNYHQPKIVVSKGGIDCMLVGDASTGFLNGDLEKYEFYAEVKRKSFPTIDSNDVIFISIDDAYGESAYTFGVNEREAKPMTSQLIKRFSINDLLESMRVLFETPNFYQMITSNDEKDSNFRLKVSIMILSYLKKTENYKMGRNVGHNHFFISFFRKGTDCQTRLHFSTITTDTNKAMEMTASILPELSKQGPKFPWKNSNTISLN